MKDKPDYDVIVVGAGPAGSTAGYVLGKFGLSVLLIDKDVFPRPKLCGGGLSYKTLRFLERVFAETESSLKKKGIIDFSTNQYEILYKSRPVSRGSSRVASHFVHRQIYDNFLLDKAKDSGADVIEGDKVIRIDPDSMEVTTSNARTIQAKFIVGADGANSLVRRQLSRRGGINTRHWRKNLGTALQVFIGRADMKRTVDHPIITLGCVKWGYGWVFPNSDGIVVGLGGLNRKNGKDFRRLFDRFLADLDLSDNTSPTVRGALVPAGNFIMNPVHGKCALVGDAAGFTHPLDGEGIYFAQRSAELVSHAVHESILNDEDFGTCYLQALRRYIYPSLASGKRNRFILFCGSGKLKYYFLKAFLSLFKKRIEQFVHGTRTYGRPGRHQKHF